MSAESPRHIRSGGPLTVPSQPPSDRSIIDAVSGFINDVTLSSSSAVDPKDVIQWARFETADINEPTPEGDSDSDISPLLLILGYGSGVQVWLIPPTGDAQEVLSWRQGTVRVLRILPTPQHGDCFASKRPLIALCDSASPGPTFCSLSFISIRGGEQVKSIKFKNPILDVLANKRSIVVSFSERFAVFDAATLEDRMTVTTCYPCPCPLGGSSPINPLALGDRWLAYADKKLNQSKRSSGGCEGEGVTSYTATVLHAAKSLSKGLRGLGESVAHSLAGGRSTSQSPSPPNADMQQPGVVTILDIEGNDEDDGQDSDEPYDPIVAHFIAHSEAIIALQFDASGMLLVTADRRGHDFHVFRINPHPCGPSLASVHHLYILHRGDTTAKVQDIAVSWDSRWAAVSTLRGTTHVFAISAYGGAPAVRTHTQPRVVNRLSRFHRSAGLPIAHHPHPAHPHAHAPQPVPKRNSGSPVGDGITQGAWFPNPRLPPYPAPTTVCPLAQLRPTANLPTHTITRNSSGRQRLSSVSEEGGSPPLLARARFGVCAGAGGRAAPCVLPALYLMAANGSLLHLVLHPRPASNIPKEKVCDESPIEVEVEAAAQWPLQRAPAAAPDLLAPLPPSNPLLQTHKLQGCVDVCMSEEERWLSQVEIVTHAGPHRRLWMGPQFVFKTYNCTGSTTSLSEAEAVEVCGGGVARSNPVNVPAASRPLIPVLVDSGSASSLEQSPSEGRRRSVAPACDLQLKEDLAEAMREDHGWCREARPEGAEARVRVVERAVDPLGCVVASEPARPPPPLDLDAHTSANEDEARFRPVVRAPAALPPPAAIARPLPRGTTIPVQSLQPDPCLCPRTDSPPLPLTTDVIIPAASLPLDTYEARDCDATVSSYDGDPPPAPLQYEDSSQSLPKSSPASADIQSTARTRFKKSPTPISDADDRVSCKDDVCLGSETTVLRCVNEFKDVREFSDSTEAQKPSVAKKVKESSVAKSIEESSLNVKVRESSLTREVRGSKEKREVRDTSGTREAKDSKIGSETRKCSETKELKESCVNTATRTPSLTRGDRGTTESKEVKVIRKDKKPSEERESRKSSIPKEIRAASETKDNKESKKVKKPSESKVVREKSLPRENSQSVETIKSRELKESVQTKESKSPRASVRMKRGVNKEDLEKSDNKESSISLKEETSTSSKISSVATKPPFQKVTYQSKAKEHDIKTEEQAWDMLLIDHEKPVDTSLLVLDDKNGEEPKPKTKRSRKMKKGQDDPQVKMDDDSFVEIHTIEDKQQTPSGELVSISTPYDDMESSSSFYVPRSKKSRSPKSQTSERGGESSNNIFDLPDQEGSNFCIEKFNNFEKVEDSAFEFEIKRDFSSVLKSRNTLTELSKSDIQKDDSNIHLTAKEMPKSKKSKSLSPYSENRRSADKDKEVKDVYVIDTSKEDFPEIQITRGCKARKKSPQPLEKKSTSSEVPIKSWSSIAASKSGKQTDDVEKNVEPQKNLQEICLRDELKDAAGIQDDNTESSAEVSLQDKLIELCKRTDIMVAECDAPSELNFIEEHHAVLHDLPPLEPLDFGLNDFRLEVMRDSLLEVNDTKLTSPICKINIDDILSSIKETTSKVIESSTFNLIDLEKVPAKREKGFSVVESHKITSQEVKLDDETLPEEKESEVMDKWSDDDVASPVVSTDSDKDDKRGAGTSNIIQPSSKQSTKSKKSRRKKK